MLKRRLLASGALALWLALLSGLAEFDVSLPKGHANEEKSAAQAKQEASDQEKRLADYTFWLALLTGGIVGTGILQVVVLLRADETSKESVKFAGQVAGFAAIQTDNLIKQKEIARRQFFAQHRPKLEIRFVQRLRANPYLGGASRRIYVEFSVINTGTSTATITGSRVRLDWFYVDDVPNPDAMGGNDSIIPERRMLVSARARCSVDVNEESSFAEGFSDEPEDRLVHAKLILLGWIVYHDDRGSEFGDTRTTYFCRAYDPKTERFAPIPELSDWEFTH